MDNLISQPLISQGKSFDSRLTAIQYSNEVQCSVEKCPNSPLGGTPLKRLPLAPPFGVKGRYKSWR